MNPFVADLVERLFLLIWVISVVFGFCFVCATPNNVEEYSCDYKKKFKKMQKGAIALVIVIASFGMFYLAVSGNAPEVSSVCFSSESNVYHYYGCEHIEKIKKENLQYYDEKYFFESNNDPYETGTYYRACSSCSKYIGNLALYERGKRTGIALMVFLYGSAGAVYLYSYIKERKKKKRW